MNKALVNDYLVKSGMEAAQAETLSQILAQTATRDDLLILGERVEGRLRAMEENMDSRLVAFEHRLDSGLQQIRQEMVEMETRLMWRFVALMGAFAALITALDVMMG